MNAPIVVCISSYKESKLIQGTIRSVLPLRPMIVVFDGPTADWDEVPGDTTDVGDLITRIHIKRKSWDSEHEKRTEMVEFAYSKLKKDFWILTLDADEILIWPEFLEDWINTLRPEEGETVIPIKRTEAEWTEGGFLSDVSPSRLIHSSIFKRYLVSCWIIETPNGNTIDLGHYRAPRQPMYGEPHVHHRSYLRRIERAQFRSHKGEEVRYTEELREGLEDIPTPT